MGAGSGGDIGDAERWVRQADEAIGRLRALGIDAFSHGGRMLAVEGADHLYRVFFDAMGEAAATLDDDGLVLHANPRLASLFKRPIERLRGTRLLSALEGFPPGLDVGSTWRGRVVLHSDEGASPFLCTVVPVFDRGSPFRCMVLADLADVERAEGEAQERSRQLFGLAGAVPGGLIRVRLGQGDVTLDFATEGTFRLLGLPLPQGRPDVGMLWSTLSHDVRSALLDAWDVAGDVRVLEAELPVMLADGSKRWVGLEAKPDRQDDGAIVWNGYLHDITPSKRAEEERLLAAAVFDSARQGIMVTKEDGTILHVNPGFEVITGYRADEAIGKPARMLSSGLTPKEVYAGMWSALKSDGHWEGELLNRRRNGELFHELLTIDAVPAVEGGVAYYVGVFGDITARKKREEQSLYLAQHDPLTGLMNRAVLDERLPGLLALAERGSVPLTLLFIDLDRFKEINDRHGHDIGDRVLEASARRISDSIRSTDLAVRQGGDEFIVVMPGLGADEAVKGVCEALLSSLKQPLDVQGLRLSVDASIGVAVYPEDGRSTQELLVRADAAMYAAKKGGRGGFRFHSEARNARLSREAQRLEVAEGALVSGRTELRWSAMADAETGLPEALCAELLMIDADGRPVPALDDPGGAGAGLGRAWGLRAFALVVDAMAGETLPAGEAWRVSSGISAELLEDDDAFHALEALLTSSPLSAGRLIGSMPWKLFLGLKPPASARLESLRVKGLGLHLAAFDASAPILELLTTHRPLLASLGKSPDGSPGKPHDAAFLRVFSAACRAAGVSPCSPAVPIDPDGGPRPKA